MSKLKEVYNLRNDNRTIRNVQEASLDKNLKAGFEIENGLLFGTSEWFKAIEANLISTHIIKGLISKVYMAGHNDYPEFEIENDEGKTIWTRKGIDELYKVGKIVELVYIEQKRKGLRIFSKCVIQIKIEK